MQIIKEVIKKIESLGSSKSAGIMAKALASACNSKYGVSLLDVSCNLEKANQELVIRLCGIRAEPDFSNASQDMALHWL